MPRDGRFLEKLGTYNPLLAKDSEDRIKMNVERIQYWLGQGAQPTDRIARMLEAAGAERENRPQQPQGRRPRQAHGRTGQEESRPRRSPRRSVTSIWRGPCPARVTDRKGASVPAAQLRLTLCGDPSQHLAVSSAGPANAR